MPCPADDTAAPPASGEPTPRDGDARRVRDDFTFPALDHAQIGVLKRRAEKLGVSARKNELLRAGVAALAALAALSDAELVDALQADKAAADKHRTT